MSWIQPTLVLNKGAVVVTPLEKRLEAYEQFQQLLKGRKLQRNETVTLISRQFGVSKWAVYNWFKGGSPFGRRAGRITTKEELFYVIGALLGDGSIYLWKNNYYVWLLGEREFASKFANKIIACANRKVASYKYRNRNVWFVCLRNAELYFLVKGIRQDLNILTGLLNSGDALTNTLQLIEGFFDAEGCVKVIKEKVRRTPKICLDFSNTNARILELIRKLLKDTLDVEARLSVQQDTRRNRLLMYHLRIYRKGDIRRFLENVRTIKMKNHKKMYVRRWLQ